MFGQWYQVPWPLVYPYNTLGLGMGKSELTWNLGTTYQVDLKEKESVNKSGKYCLETALDISQ